MIFAGSRPRVPPAAGGLGFVAVLLALALAGCDAGSVGAPASSASSPAGTPTVSESPATGTPASEPPTSEPPTSGTPTPGETSKTAAPSRSAENEAVTLVRSGGLAGLSESITVQPDGRWKLGNANSTVRTGQLSDAQMSRLQALVADPRLAAEAGRGLSTTTRCNDTFSYLLMVDHQVIKYEECPGQEEPPKVTMEIITLLRRATAL